MSPKYLGSCLLLKIFNTNVDNLCPPLPVMKAKHINKVFISFHFTFFNFSFSAFSSFSHFWDDLTKFLAANWCKRKVVTPSSHSLNGPLYKWTPVTVGETLPFFTPLICFSIRQTPLLDRNLVPVLKISCLERDLTVCTLLLSVNRGYYMAVWR